MRKITMLVPVVVLALGVAACAADGETNGEPADTTTTQTTENDALADELIESEDLQKAGLEIAWDLLPPIEQLNICNGVNVLGVDFVGETFADLYNSTPPTDITISDTTATEFLTGVC